ncbi:MAG: hypothetical protein M9894_27585 [Planctomycetes bacterium]|nr:hypothetical protein [Planctomycetota bacterium]
MTATLVSPYAALSDPLGLAHLLADPMGLAHLASDPNDLAHLALAGGADDEADEAE